MQLPDSNENTERCGKVKKNEQPTLTTVLLEKCRQVEKPWIREKDLTGGPRVGEERRQGERLRKKNGNELCECSSFSAFKRISVWKMGKITIVKTQESV